MIARSSQSVKALAMLAEMPVVLLVVLVVPETMLVLVLPRRLLMLLQLPLPLQAETVAAMAATLETAVVLPLPQLQPSARPQPQPHRQPLEPRRAPQLVVQPVADVVVRVVVSVAEVVAEAATAVEEDDLLHETSLHELDSMCDDTATVMGQGTVTRHP